MFVDDAGPLFLGLGGPSRLARHAVAEVDDPRAEGAGLDEFEVHPALTLGKEWNATAHPRARTHTEPTSSPAWDTASR